MKKVGFKGQTIKVVLKKYKLIIEEEYQYTTDTPDDIARIINSYVNYT